MTVSSRTPEGTPSRCSLCGYSTNIEFSSPAGDAPCPNCGYLLWATTHLVESITKQFRDVLNALEGSITAETSFSALGADSMDIVQLVMRFEEEYDISIPDDAAEQIQTIGDIVRYIEECRRDKGR